MTTPNTYRWNTTEFAAGYDQAADVIHPHYLAIQDAILSLLPPALEAGGLIVDLGGGSGRLGERILDRWPAVSAVIIDQSEPFLALAERRLARFGSRAVCIASRLQGPWYEQLPACPSAIVSMSAIHHLEPTEKQLLYRQCAEALQHGGLLLNGDEVRAEDEATYRRDVSTWGSHMRSLMESDRVPASFHSALEKWIDRNVHHFGERRFSGDDCHETIAVQLGYLLNANFTSADCPWQRSMWAILRGVKTAL